MSCESYLTADSDGIVLSCVDHRSIKRFSLEWESTISVEHVYAVWLKHLGES
jgi:hypothetical protein